MFSDLLRADRERAGLTLDQAARRLGVPLSTYRKLEAGERRPSSLPGADIPRLKPAGAGSEESLAGPKR
jgi:transcriptional regulator with XRE-family HTH domain